MSKVGSVVPMVVLQGLMVPAAGFLSLVVFMAMANQAHTHSQQPGQRGGVHTDGGQVPGQNVQGWNNFGLQQGGPFNNTPAFGGPQGRG